MIENEIIFVTTTLYSKWLSYQQNIIKIFFPNSQIITVDDRENWPNSWFYWIDEVKKSDKKYYIHTGTYTFVGTTSSVFIPIFLNVGTTSLVDIFGLTLEKN